MEDFTEGIDNQIKLLGIPNDLSCAYLKGHLLGRAGDWIRKLGVMLIDEVSMRVGGLIMTIDRGIGEIRKFLIDPVMIEKSSDRKRNQWLESRNELNRDDRIFD
ncbi:hypothetical protein TNCV_1353491 [Trichonephila clavipes]|nr:hypothetical protein TNCV_1353491 [Trichonephila clavipes]